MGKFFKKYKDVFYSILIGKDIKLENKENKNILEGKVLWEGKNVIILLEKKRGNIKFVIKKDFFVYIPFNKGYLKVDGIYLNKRPYERLKQKIKGKYRI